MDPANPRWSLRARGLASMLAAVACFVAMASAVKILREHGMSTAEVMVWRMAPGLPWVWLELRHRKVSLRPLRPWGIGMRCLFGGLAMAAYFWALSVLTLLQHTVLYLTQPVFVAMLAPLVVRERLRGAALVALAIAMAGAAVVVVPDSVFVTPVVAAAAVTIPLWPAVLGLASAVFSALAHVAIRQATSMRIGDTAGVDAPELVVFYFSLTVAAAALVVMLVSDSFVGVPPGLSSGHTVALIGLVAISGVLGQLLLSRAYARTDAPAVAIVGYARIPMSMGLDVVVWGTAAGISGWLGAAMMVVAGVLLVRADRAQPIA